MHHLVSHHLVTRIPTTTADAIVADLRHSIERAKTPWDSVNYIYVVNGDQRLVGVFSIKELLVAKPEQRIEKIMRRDPIAVHEHMHEETAAALAIKHSLKAVPVIDRDERFVGIVPSDAILAILHRRHTEHFLRSAGFTRPHVHFLDVVKARFSELFRARVGWLAVGLFGGMLAASITGFFEEVLRQEIILAFFIPVVVYLSDAVGTQTETLFIRSFALERIHFLRYVIRELSVGIALGAVFGLSAYALVTVLWQQAQIALILALTFFCTIIVATLVALVIPWIFIRMHRDPAIGSGPFATIIQDILSLLIYFLIASVML